MISGRNPTFTVIDEVTPTDPKWFMDLDFGGLALDYAVQTTRFLSLLDDNYWNWRWEVSNFREPQWIRSVRPNTIVGRCSHNHLYRPHRQERRGHNWPSATAG